MFKWNEWLENSHRRWKQGKPVSLQAPPGTGEIQNAHRSALRSQDSRATKGPLQRCHLTSRYMYMQATSLRC